jgi:hypothetical protein
MWHRVGLVRADVAEERAVPIIRLKRISEIGTLVTSNLTANVLPCSDSFSLDDESGTFLRNVGSNKIHKAHQTRRQNSVYLKYLA